MLLVFYVTGTRRGLGKYWSENFLTTTDMLEADVVINCKHETQLEVLEQACALRIPCITIGSNSPDQGRSIYSAQKAGVDLLNERMFYKGYDVTNIRFGYFDTPRVAHVTENKLSLKEVEDVILWVISSPHRIKDMTLLPA